MSSGWFQNVVRHLVPAAGNNATRSTIMTSNRPLEDWGKLLQDVPTAGAVLDRFLHHATVFAITGESYRLKDSALAKTGGKKHA